MYLQLGQDTVIRTDSIIGIFDLDNTTVQKGTRDFLNTAEETVQPIRRCRDRLVHFHITDSQRLPAGSGHRRSAERLV